MKLIIEIDGKKHIDSYLSILSVGILNCIEKGILTAAEAMDILYSPKLINMFESVSPSVSDAIHLGTELEDVVNIIPTKLSESIDQIKKIIMSVCKLPLTIINIFFTV